MGAQATSEQNDGLELIVRIAVRRFLGGDSLADLHAWFVDAVPVIAPDWLAQFGHDELLNY